MNLHDLNAHELLRAYRTRALSPVDVTRAVLSHIEAWEPHLHATGDGMSNYEEYIAGTHPLDALSVFRITSLQRNLSGQMALRFKSVAGKTYGVAYSDRFQPWADVAGPAFTFPSPGLCEWIDDGSKTGGLPYGAVLRRYRVNVR